VVVAVGSVVAALAGPWAAADEMAWRFDGGTAESVVMDGYRRLTGEDRYTPDRGFGWESPGAVGVEFQRPVPDERLRGSSRQLLFAEAYDNHRNALNRDAVASRGDLAFRLDVPSGRYRVAVTMGDLSRALGSIDVSFNKRRVAEHLAVWAPGGYRMLDRTPAGWWATIRGTVDVDDGSLHIKLQKNPAYYDEQMAEQATRKTPYAQWYHATPVIQEPPYHFIGYPFVANSVMAIEVTPYRPGPIVMEEGGLKPVPSIDDPALGEAIEEYNAGDFAGARAALDRVSKPNAEAAKAVVALWLAGRLEVEEERTLVHEAARVLRKHVAAHPEEHGLAELLADADVFLKALEIHTTRGEMGKNHFLENNKAIAWWWMIREDSPLYDKSRLYTARAAHMLKPYFPTLGTEGEIFKELEQKYPDNRFVRYHLHQTWEPCGDGSQYDDWVMVDYEAKAAGAPEWVRAIYPAFAGLVDLSEWWIRFRQEPEGSIGGGWGDDVEMVGLFGYYGYVSRGVSDRCVQGARNLVDGVWNLSEVDPEIGFCLPMADAEHSAEWTGNTLGMMVQIDYGNPAWLERSMKTGKLIRDLWTDYDRHGHRHFRANFFGAAQVGGGDRGNDSWINYRAVSAASAVLDYNQNPTIARLYTELADAWVAAAMSTERGKPEGVIPAQVSFPEGVLGGRDSPNWWTAAHPPGTVNYDWPRQRYKGYLLDVLFAAYEHTRDPSYLEPLRREYELACKHGFAPQRPDPLARGRGGPKPETDARPGSEPWVAAHLQLTERWLEAERLIEGRKGKLEDTRTAAEIIEHGRRVAEELKRRWPIMTSEAGPTDRVAFHGIVFPFFVYTGGSLGGPLLRAAVTYENTTKDFAAAVLAADPQGLRILYYSLAPDAREIGVVPWDLEPGGKYRLVYGEDANDDGTIDLVVERREFLHRQAGSPISLAVEPRTTYVIEVDQIARGRAVALAPDPGLSTDDIRYVPDRGMILARVHNVGSLPVRNVEVAFYDGDPQGAGRRIGTSRIPNIEAPVDLEPRTVTVGINHRIGDEPREIYVVLDPDDQIPDEITTFNNVAHARLVAPEEQTDAAPARPSFRRGRR
jgi:hypothetical protein